MHNKPELSSAAPILLPHASASAALAQAPASAAAPVDIEVSWAQHLDEVREAQRLRHQVFASEMGAQLDGRLPGHDVDDFDDFCEHLLVRHSASKQVIGTYRLLTPAQAKRAGRTYSDGEFDLSAIDALRRPFARPLRLAHSFLKVPPHVFSRPSRRPCRGPDHSRL